MTRWKIVIEYDGRAFVGWQRQGNGPSVQAALETAIERFANEVVRVHGAGRTDAGVHALGQVGHFDLNRPATARTVRDALNAHLGAQGVAVLAAEAVADSFHARLSARGRAYLYRILNRRAPPALDLGRVWHVRRTLDAEAMHAAAQVLVGRHDFSTFRAALCQARSPVKTLDVLDVGRVGAEIHVVARARSFLHHQVRAMVGSLYLVGAGKWSAADLQAALAACDRARGGPTAPPEGLYFTGAWYEGEAPPAAPSRQLVEPE
jgi:tRNA pseudouridine38-40 synthase